jgi:hypothetical protein
MADVSTASFAHAEFDVLARSALALAGIESDVGHEFSGIKQPPRVEGRSL